MHHNEFSRKFRDERGFSLIELLVVILVIGILAGIALPNFISQRDRANDSHAKSNVRNTMTQVEACYTKTEDYADCDSTAELGSDLGVPLGTSAGQVEVVADAGDGYTLTAHSKTASTFSIKKASGTWIVTRSCTVAPGRSDAGCKNSKW